MYMSVYGGRMNFCGVKNKELHGSDTSCKEEIGFSCVSHKMCEIVIDCRDQMTDQQVQTLKKFLNKNEKKIKVRRTVIKRVKNRPNWLYLKYSPLWHKNSVAHSIYMTWLRDKVHSILNVRDVYDCNDEEHLRVASRVIGVVLKKGLKVFSRKQQPDYDVGVVSFIRRFEDGQFNSKAPLQSPRPTRSDFDSDYDYWDALDEWEDDYYSDDDGAYYGDLDRPLDRNHPYKKLVACLKK